MAAQEYLMAKLAEGKKESATTYPLNRGDITILFMLIERELRSASSDWTDPLNGKRLTAIREKLGDSWQSMRHRCPGTRLDNFENDRA